MVVSVCIVWSYVNMQRAWKLVYAIPWLCMLGVGLWLIGLRIPFNGIRAFHFPLDGRSVWFDPFLPGQRTSTIGLQSEGWIGQRLFQEPVYAALRLPGVYDEVSLGLDFRTTRQPLVDIGFRQEPGGGFAMQPLWSEVLSKGWRAVAWEGQKGFVRDDRPDSDLGIQDMDQVLVWHASTTAPAWMDSVPLERTFPVALRGAYDIRAIPVNGVIDFRIQVQDMNRARQKGSAVFSLSQNDTLLWSEALSLTGSRDRAPSQVFEKIIHIENLSAGVYTLSMTSDDDIFVRQIRSPLRHWVIGPRLYLGDQVGYSTTTLSSKVWTNAHHLVLQTFHNEGKQTVIFGSSEVSVTSTQVEYRLDRSLSELTTAQAIQVPKSDMRIVGDGYFSFAPDLLFLPAPRRLTDASNPIAEGVRAIITPYVPPQVLGDGWYRSNTHFLLASRPGTLRLTLGAPGILERQGMIDVRAVHLSYTRPALGLRPWLRAVWREVASAWHML